MDVESPMQDCLDVNITGAYKSKMLGGIYQLFVSECGLGHLGGGGGGPVSATMFDRWSGYGPGKF